jgi:hypothetical protein
MQRLNRFEMVILVLTDMISGKYTIKQIALKNKIPARGIYRYLSDIENIGFKYNKNWLGRVSLDTIPPYMESFVKTLNHKI